MPIPTLPSVCIRNFSVVPVLIVTNWLPPWLPYIISLPLIKATALPPIL